MAELRKEGCYPKALVGVNSGLAFADAVIAVLSFTQVFIASSAIIVKPRRA